jgi:hypothetical protein
MTRSIARGAVAALLVLAASGARAQSFSTYKPHETMYLFNYEMSSGLGSFKDNFIGDTSWAGMSFEGRTMVKEKISAGIGFYFNRFDQTFDQLTVNAPQGGVFTAPVYRYADQFAIKALVHYYLRDDGLRPYAGVGIGGVWAYSYAQTADIAASESNFDFIVSPEIGITFQAGGGASKFGFNAAIRYNYTTADWGKAPGAVVNDAQYLNYVVGIFGAY